MNTRFDKGINFAMTEEECNKIISLGTYTNKLSKCIG